MSIIVKDLNFCYENSPVKALKNINITINDNSFVGIIGHTGSGKSTFVNIISQILNTENGNIEINGIKLDKKNRQEIRKQIGIVFQYPENQLFEETVEREIAFGPKNMGLSKEEIQKRVDESIDQVGLDKKLKPISPFELSGGQKRLVSIACVLSMKPNILILDEPTSSLDPVTSESILDMFFDYHKSTKGITIMVNHNMEEIAKYSDMLLVFNKGEIILSGNPKEVFSKREELLKIGLKTPVASTIASKLQKKGAKLPSDIITEDELVNSIVDLKSRKR